MDPRDDDALMAAIASGDEAALRALIERWERRVLAFLYRTLGSADDARDLAQETFVKVYLNAGGYASRGRFGAWLFRIAGNLARNEIRRRSVRGLLGIPWFRGDDRADDPHAALDRLEAPAGERPDAALARAEEAERVRRALLKLPERQRVAVVLKRFEGFSQEEIAEAMGISVKAVEALLVRGTAALRKGLGRGG